MLTICSSAFLRFPILLNLICVGFLLLVYRFDETFIFGIHNCADIIICLLRTRYSSKYKQFSMHDSAYGIFCCAIGNRREFPGFAVASFAFGIFGQSIDDYDRTWLFRVNAPTVTV